MLIFGDQQFQYLAAFSVSILTLTVGCNIAWPSPSLPLLKSDDSPIGIKLSVVQASWASSITMIGLLTGNLFLGQVQDLLGRRRLLLLSTIPIIISWLTIMFSRSFEVLLVARFFSGMATVVPSGTSVVYIGEISEPCIRGRLGMFNLLMLQSGIVLITAVGSYTNYNASSLLSVGISVVFLLIFWWMPESPYYYLRKGNTDKAKQCLQRLRAHSDVDKEFIEMQSCVEREMKEKSDIWELFKSPKYRKSVLLGLGLKTLQQLSGTGAINTYNKLIFDQVSTGLDSRQSAVITTAIAVPATFIGSMLIDKLGRKPLYYFSIIGCIIALTFEFIYFFMQDYMHDDVSNIGWLPLLGIFVFNFLGPFAVQTLPFVYISEVFPANVKAVALNIIFMYSSFLGFIVLLGFPLLEDLLGIYTCFGIFIVFCLLGFCFIVFFVPETKGKSLGDIQNKLEGNVKIVK